MVLPTPMEEVPQYLAVVGILHLQGNIEADVLAEVAKISRRLRKSLPWISIAVAGIIVAAVGSYLALARNEPLCHLTADVLAVGGTEVPSGMFIEVMSAGDTKAYLVSKEVALPIDLGPFTRKDQRWTIAQKAASLGRKGPCSRFADDR
jgi:hypothetical protein